MKKIILILVTSILSTATFAQFAQGTIPLCDDLYQGEGTLTLQTNCVNDDPFSFDKLRSKWNVDKQLEALERDLYKGVPQSFRY